MSYSNIINDLATCSNKSTYEDSCKSVSENYLKVVKMYNFGMSLISKPNQVISVYQYSTSIIYYANREQIFNYMSSLTPDEYKNTIPIYVIQGIVNPDCLAIWETYNPRLCNKYIMKFASKDKYVLGSKLMKNIVMKFALYNKTIKDFNISEREFKYYKQLEIFNV